jgi:hypothetical protein
MEAVDRKKVMELIWPVLRGQVGEELRGAKIEALLKAVAEGYSFPTNLDHDPPPVGGVSLDLCWCMCSELTRLALSRDTARHVDERLQGRVV